MNDVMNRFGFTENAVHGRVPGPFVPLQDEPQEVGSVPVRKNTKTVLVPQIQSMKDYILKHHKRMLLRSLNQCITTGDVLDVSRLYSSQNHQSVRGRSAHPIIPVSPGRRFFDMDDTV